MAFLDSVLASASIWVGSIPVVIGLLFTAIQIRHVKKSQRVSNHLTITQHHREIWSKVLQDPELTRILNPKVDLRKRPVTDKESLFVTFLILHLKAAYAAGEADVFVTPEGLQQDIKWFFFLPIPRAVWERSKSFQDRGFRAFVESALAVNEDTLSR